MPVPIAVTITPILINSSGDWPTHLTGTSESKQVNGTEELGASDPNESSPSDETGASEDGKIAGMQRTIANIILEFNPKQIHIQVNRSVSIGNEPMDFGACREPPVTKASERQPFESTIRSSQTLS